MMLDRPGVAAQGQRPILCAFRTRFTVAGPWAGRPPWSCVAAVGLAQRRVRGGLPGGGPGWGGGAVVRALRTQPKCHAPPEPQTKSPMRVPTATVEVVPLASSTGQPFAVIGPFG